MERGLHTNEYARLEDEARNRLARCEAEDRVFEEVCKRQIKSLDSGHNAKLENFDVEMLAKENEVKDETCRKISELKLKHEAELEALKKKHMKQLVDLENRGKVDLKIVVTQARDSRAGLERAFLEKIEETKKSHEQQKESRLLQRESERSEEIDRLVSVFHKSVSGSSSEPKPSKPVTTPEVLSLDSSSPPYSPSFEDNSTEVILQVKREDHETVFDHGSVSMPLEIEDEPTSDAVEQQGSKSSAPWGFGARYFKAKDTLAALPITTRSDANPLQKQKKLPVKPLSHVVTKKAAHMNKDINSPPNQILSSAKGSSQFMPTGNLAKRTSPVSKAPLGAPKGPRRLFHDRPTEQVVPIVNFGDHPQKGVSQEGDRSIILDQGSAPVRDNLPVRARAQESFRESSQHRALHGFDSSAGNHNYNGSLPSRSLTRGQSGSKRPNFDESSTSYILDPFSRPPIMAMTDSWRPPEQRYGSDSLNLLRGQEGARSRYMSRHESGFRDNSRREISDSENTSTQKHAIHPHHNHKRQSPKRNVPFSRPDTTEKMVQFSTGRHRKRAKHNYD